IIGGQLVGIFWTLVLPPIKCHIYRPRTQYPPERPDFFSITVTIKRRGNGIKVTVKMSIEIALEIQDQVDG
ncbi:hypothetical protein STEG23_027056, partial [Scotinomys teguina]